MLALLAAASVAAAPPVAPRLLPPDAPLFLKIRACGLQFGTPVNRTPPAPRARKLGDLPRANLELPVLRLGSDGCPTPVIVRYDVEGDGRFGPSAESGR